MKLLINASNIHIAGPLQVAISVIHELKHFPDHEYYLYLSAEVENQIDLEQLPANFHIYRFSGYARGKSWLSRGWMLIRRLRRSALLEKVINPDAVFTVFGPIYWKPKSPHLAGYAIPFSIYKESPYFKEVPRFELLKRKLINQIRTQFFLHNTDHLVVETDEVRERMIKSFAINPDRISVVSNTVSNIYYQPAAWSDKITLPPRIPGEVRLITVSANHLYKNLSIIDPVITLFRKLKPELKIKFILTVQPEQLKISKENLKYIHFAGPIKVNECPHLYRQCDFMFLPSLLDCFSATYPEAMKMGLPILTSDLPFARNVCKDAAVYFDPVNPEDIVRKIISVVNDPVKGAKMIAYGKRQLSSFETATSRVEKYLKLAEELMISVRADERGLQNIITTPPLQ
ncbi:MAG: glycosyltransferase [Lentimicrobium sp.]|nr:glycosyltransferase [Lentimicrobium sp.]